MSEATPELAKALAAVQADLPRIEKTQRADVSGETKQGKQFSYSYMYADLANITDKIMPLLGKNGLAFTARPTRTEGGGLMLAYQLMHESGETLEGEFPLKGDGTPQAIGSAITYARRYCLCAVTGVAPEDDDDDAAAAQEQASKKGTAQRQTKPRTTAQRDVPEQRAKPQPTAQRARPAPPPLPGEVLSDKQKGMMLALFNGAGITDRGERLQISTAIIGREVSSANELTKSEASKLIDALQQASDDSQARAALLGIIGRSLDDDSGPRPETDAD